MKRRERRITWALRPYVQRLAFSGEKPQTTTMTGAMILGIVMVGVLGFSSAYPTLQDQDYLEYIAELAAAKVRSL